MNVQLLFKYEKFLFRRQNLTLVHVSSQRFCRLNGFYYLCNHVNSINHE